MFGMSCLLCLACSSGKRDTREIPEPESYPPGALEAPSADEKAAVAELGPVDGCEGKFPTTAGEIPKRSNEVKKPASRVPPQIQATIRSHFSEFRGCYEPRLRFNPNLEGKVKIQFVILPSGEVTRVHIPETTIPDCFVPSCLADAFQRMTFPSVSPAEGVTTVTYPVMFSPG